MNCYNIIKNRISNIVSYIISCIIAIDTFHNNHLDKYLFNDIMEDFENNMQDHSTEAYNNEPTTEASNIEPTTEASNIELTTETPNVESVVEASNIEPTTEPPNVESIVETPHIEPLVETLATLRQRLKNIKSDDTDGLEDKSDNFNIKDKQKERYGRFHSELFLDDLYDDADEMIYQTFQLIKRYTYCDKIQNLIYYVKDNIKPNAIKMIMCLVWLYSWALFQFAKATEFFFRNLIRFPEQLFIFVDILCSQPKNIDDKSIHVLSAFNETGDITNRFKLFLWKYWNTTREIHDENGVDIGKFIKLFNCTMLYCSYLLKDSSNLDQEYEKQVKRMLITKQEVKGKFQRFTKKDLKFASVSSRDSQKSHDIINDEFLHDIIMEDANNELQSKETNLLFSHCTFE